MILLNKKFITLFVVFEFSKCQKTGSIFFVLKN